MHMSDTRRSELAELARRQSDTEMEKGTPVTLTTIMMDSAISMRLWSGATRSLKTAMVT